jgi:hypothetical protein
VAEVARDLEDDLVDDVEGLVEQLRLMSSGGLTLMRLPSPA